MAGMQQVFPYIYTDIAEEMLRNLRDEWRLPITSPLDLGFMIIQQCVGFLFNQRARHNKRFRFLNIYEQQLNEIVSCLIGNQPWKSADITDALTRPQMK
jgi:hypothetical protein